MIFNKKVKLILMMSLFLHVEIYFDDFPLLKVSTNLTCNLTGKQKNYGTKYD